MNVQWGDKEDTTADPTAVAAEAKPETAGEQPETGTEEEPAEREESETEQKGETSQEPGPEKVAAASERAEATNPSQANQVSGDSQQTRKRRAKAKKISNPGRESPSAEGLSQFISIRRW